MVGFLLNEGTFVLCNCTGFGIFVTGKTFITGQEINVIDVSECLKVGELISPRTSDMISYGFIKPDDSSMIGFTGLIEFVDDVFVVGSELILSMREGKLKDFSSFVPHSCPARVGCDLLQCCL